MNWTLQILPVLAVFLLAIGLHFLGAHFSDKVGVILPVVFIGSLGAGLIVWRIVYKKRG